jgi:hypothetical protein
MLSGAEADSHYCARLKLATVCAAQKKKEIFKTKLTIQKSFYVYLQIK